MTADELRSELHDGRAGLLKVEQAQRLAELLATGQITAGNLLGAYGLNNLRLVRRLAWEMTAREVRHVDRWRRAWEAAGWWACGVACGFAAGLAAWAIAGGRVI